MIKRKVVVIGNSVTIRVRPKTNNDLQNIYSFILNDKLSNYGNYEVVNIGKTRYLTSEFVEDRNRIIKFQPDYYILNVGCVDAPPREIPRWFSDIIFHRRYALLFPLSDFIYKHIIKKYLRKKLMFLRGKKPWVNIEDFRKNIQMFVQDIKQHTTAKIIIIGINKGNSRIENALPGILGSYFDYNNVLIEESRNANCIFVDVSDLESIDHFPDGVHYNKKGHQIIANRLFNLMNYDN